jgi:hypothetical protein
MPSDPFVGAVLIKIKHLFFLLFPSQPQMCSSLASSAMEIVQDEAESATEEIVEVVHQHRHFRLHGHRHTDGKKCTLQRQVLQRSLISWFSSVSLGFSLVSLVSLFALFALLSLCSLQSGAPDLLMRLLTMNHNPLVRIGVYTWQ